MLCPTSRRQGRSPMRSIVKLIGLSWVSIQFTKQVLSQGFLKICVLRLDNTCRNLAYMRVQKRDVNVRLEISSECMSHYQDFHSIPSNSHIYRRIFTQCHSQVLEQSFFDNVIILFDLGKDEILMWFLVPL